MRFSREFLLSMALLTAAAIFLQPMSRGEVVPLRKNLADFPLPIDAWTGIPSLLEPDILRVLRLDDYLMRQYSHAKGPPIGLYVGYYKSLQQGASYHSPKHCLPGNGWYFAKMQTMRLDIAAPNGGAAEINQVLIKKGLDKQFVFYWYQDRGRIITSDYWAKIYLVLDAITKHRTDGALVRVTVPVVGDDEETAHGRGKAFVENILPLLQGHLPS
jgi:EpsI family protein